MIGIRLSRNYFLKLQRKIGITITLANLFFTEELEYGEMVNTVTVSAKENNALNAKNIHTEDALITFPITSNDNAEVFKDTVKIMEGKFTYQQTTEDEIDLDIVTGIHGLPFINKKLGELYAAFETPVYFDTPEDLIQHAKDQNDFFTVPNPKYVFPTIHNADFYGGNNPNFTERINRWDGINNKFIVNPRHFDYLTWENTDTLCPQVFIIKALKEIFLYHGNITLAGNLITDASFSDYMLIYNNRSLDLMVKLKSVIVNTPAIFDIGLGGGQFGFGFGTEDRDVENIHDIATGEIVIKRAGKFMFECFLESSYTNVTTYIFEIRIGANILFTKSIDRTDPADREFIAIVEATEADVGLHFKTYFFKGDGTMLRLNFGSHLYVSTPDPDAGYNIYENELKISNHFPDITLGDLINRLKTAGFKIDFDKSSNTINIDYIANEVGAYPSRDYTKIGSSKFIKKVIGPQIKSVQFEFPDSDELKELIIEEFNTSSFVAIVDAQLYLPTPTSVDQLALVQNTRQIYKSSFDIISSTIVWGFYKYYYPKDLYHPDGETEYLIRASPVLTRYIRDYDTGNRMIVPAIKQQGSTSAYNIGQNNNTDVRIFFWKEVGSDELGVGNYPFASSLALTSDGTLTGPLFEFYLVTDWGLKHWVYAGWFNLLNIGVVWTRTFYFNIIQLLNFNPNKPFRFRSHSFLPKTSQLSVTSDSQVTEATIDYIEIHP